MIQVSINLLLGDANLVGRGTDHLDFLNQFFLIDTFIVVKKVKIEVCGKGAR